MRRRVWLSIVIGACAVVASAAWVAFDRPGPSPEVLPVMLPLEGGPERPEAEISGMAWHGDDLVLLPQYPRRFGPDGGAIFVASRASIEAVVEGDADTIEFRTVPLEAPGLEESLDGFDGFESIAFAGDDAYLTVEVRGRSTVGFVLRGRAHGSPLERLSVALEPRAQLSAQTDLANTAYEALVVTGSRVIALYEANGDVNPSPRALAFDRSLAPIGELPMSPVEYRVTDASDADGEGRFWVANYHWPGSPWQPGTCELTAEYGQGESHARCRTVERLVELTARGRRVETTHRPPILFHLTDDEHARNWEGLVRLPGRGFLVMTDEHPASILAFVPAR